MKQLILEIPSNAFDVRIGTNMQTQGLLFKTPRAHNKQTWDGHFISFGSASQTPVAGIAKRFIREGTKVIVYA